MHFAILSLGVVSFAVSWVVTFAMKRVAPRVGFVDKPGHRKIHHDPKPLGGGVGIFLGFALPLLAGLAFVNFTDPVGPAAAGEWAGRFASHWAGARAQTPLALALLGACAVLHVMGLLDDRRAMGPYVKLGVQLAVTAAVVVVGDLRALTVLGYWPSAAASVLWIVGITNAFNFLDNMDGLSGGVAAICAAAFLAAALSIGQWFVAAALILLLGAVLGFLCFNFPPATIFMGDAGSLVVGFVLGALTVRTTFLPPGVDLGAGWYALLAPVIVLALPLYDLTVVSVIRLRGGRSPFVGDTNHFSHRLVRRGMSRRTAVLCIYLVTAATAVAAVVLPHLTSPYLAVLMFGQTLLILGLVALLEQHPLPPPPPADGPPGPAAPAPGPSGSPAP